MSSHPSQAVRAAPVLPCSIRDIYSIS